MNEILEQHKDHNPAICAYARIFLLTTLQTLDDFAVKDILNKFDIDDKLYISKGIFEDINTDSRYIYIACGINLDFAYCVMDDLREILVNATDKECIKIITKAQFKHTQRQGKEYVDSISSQQNHN